MKYPKFLFFILKLLGENEFINKAKERIDYINKINSTTFQESNMYVAVVSIDSPYIHVYTRSTDSEA